MEPEPSSDTHTRNGTLGALRKEYVVSIICLVALVTISLVTNKHVVTNSTLSVDSSTNKNVVTNSTLPVDSSTPVSAFDMAVAKSHDVAFATLPSVLRKTFDVNTWTKTTTGGLRIADRTLLAEIYGQANSVFEYGLGESTYIADHVGVARYAGIDSDASWVANARDSVSTHFRFYFADIGETKAWGFPNKVLPKSILDYQVVPLVAEPEAFDVYMVDGRWRMACLMLTFLHASARGADSSQTIVLLHDCLIAPDIDRREEYLKAEHLLDLVRHSGDRLCVYQRKPATTDEELYAIWLQNFDVVK
jgi:hypothetical protein